MNTRIILFAAAMFAVCACNKDNAPAEGKQMTISVNAGGTKVSGTDNGTQINFTWEEGDTVWVNATGKFKLSSGAGTSTASFTGVMPPGQTTIWNISYNSNPDLSSQTYNGNKLPADKMSFFVMNINGLDNPATLEPKTAVLQLNFRGTQTISKITVEQLENKELTSFYTLNFDTPVQLESTTSKAFYIVVNPASSKFNIKAYNGETNIFDQTTSKRLSPTMGECLDMPTLELN